MTSSSFHPEHRYKALGVTLLLHAIILCLFYFFSMNQPKLNVPVLADEGIEVNLGNSDIGFGDIQPLVPGDPAPNSDPNTNQSKSGGATGQNEKEEAENQTDESTTIQKDKKTKNKKDKDTDQKNKNNQDNKDTKTKEKKAKAVMSGGNGTVGNQSDDFNKSNNQGITNGNRDQGKENGNPDSDNYKGNGSGNGNLEVVKGNRKIVQARSLKGDLPAAVIYARIDVDAKGNARFKRIEKRSSTRENQYAKAIKEFLPGIKFNETTGNSEVVVKFVFIEKD